MEKLTVVGIGPGDYDNMTVRADRALAESAVIIGYGVYIDLVRDRYPDKEFLSTPMTKEADRCRMALESARSGRRTAMVCSGDSSGAALLGAPLTHDFAVISLSDRLTPWEKIEKRLEAAAEADLAVVLYNPASKGRPDYLQRACDILLRRLPADRPCGVARNIGREGESREVMDLRSLRDFPADMFCTVFVGNSQTVVTGGALVTPRGYRDV